MKTEKTMTFNKTLTAVAVAVSRALCACIRARSSGYNTAHQYQLVQKILQVSYIVNLETGLTDDNGIPFLFFRI